MIQILLILSGSVEVNPGPRRTRVKFPCGECKKAITTNNAIACDECNKWYHVNCLSMNASVFNAYTKDELLEWICPNCALANISNSLFDSFSASSTAESDNDDDENQNNPPKTKRQSLRIMIVNFQSIWGKKENLQKLLYDHNIDVVLGSETHIDPSIGDSDILPNGYRAFRNDRLHKSGGGVIIIVKNSLFAVEAAKSKDSESISVKIETFQKPIILTSVYRPTNKNQKYLDSLIKDIKSTLSKFKSNPHWIGGDLNLPDIDWSTNSITSSQYPKSLNESFLDMLGDNNLEQLVDF
eukprot:TCONS_00057045-protein